eukprot:IDg4959t1
MIPHTPRPKRKRSVDGPPCVAGRPSNADYIRVPQVVPPGGRLSLLPKDGWMVGTLDGWCAVSSTEVAARGAFRAADAQQDLNGADADTWMLYMDARTSAHGGFARFKR